MSGSSKKFLDPGWKTDSESEEGEGDMDTVEMPTTEGITEPSKTPKKLQQPSEVQEYQLKSTLKDSGIGDTHFEEVASEACNEEKELILKPFQQTIKLSTLEDIIECWERELAGTSGQKEQEQTEHKGTEISGYDADDEYEGESDDEEEY